MNLNTAIETALNNWHSIPLKQFTKVYDKGNKCALIIRFRDTSLDKSLFNEIEPIKGIKFIDVLGLEDYFLGEFIVINKKIFNPIVSSYSIMLKIDSKKNIPVKIRDDGFIKVYKTTKKAIIITVI